MLDVGQKSPAEVLHTSALKVTAVVKMYPNRRGERGPGAAAAASGLWLGSKGPSERLGEKMKYESNSREGKGEPCPGQTELSELKIIVSWITDHFWCPDYSQ